MNTEAAAIQMYTEEWGRTPTPQMWGIVGDQWRDRAQRVLNAATQPNDDNERA